MKKMLCCVLSVVMLLACVPFVAFADSSYSTTSNKNVELQYPTADCYFDVPQLATVKATKTNGSIYFMPTPKDGNGVLGTVANGTRVTVLAEKSGYYFFQTSDGRMGWNGGKFLEFKGPATAAVTYFAENSFVFDSGASFSLPAGFISTNTERDRNNAYVNYYYTNFEQGMDLIMTQIDTCLYNQQDTDFLNSMYSSLKRDYPNPTYDSKNTYNFDLSGYSGSDIYYFKGVLSNQIIYLIKMFYPARNRNVCDSYVEKITNSFAEPSGVSIIWGWQPSNTTTLNLPDNPASPYGIALRDNLLNGVSYNDWQKKDVVNETYYARKDNKGEREDWYTSASYEDYNTGYLIGLYYADGMVFFADAYHKGERSSVTFYFWGDQLLCVHDMRYGYKDLRFAGSDTYNAIVSEFDDVYAQAIARAPGR